MTIFIHIGVPKSGTTTLQTRVFPGHPQIDFRSWPTYEEMPTLYDAIYGENQYVSPEALDRCRREIAQNTTYAGKPILFSREHLTHEIFNKGLIAERLRAAFGDFKMIITIREQLSMLESAYLWHQRTIRRPWAGGIPVRSFDSYIGSHWNALRAIKRTSRLTTGDYGAIVRHYVRLLGKENVGIFLFEEMVRSRGDFCKKLFGFMDVDAEIGEALLAGKAANPRLTTWEYRYWAALAYLTPVPINRLVQKVVPESVLRVLASGPPMKVTLSKEWRDRLAEFYLDGNRYLVNEFGLPLERYGYAV